MEGLILIKRGKRNILKKIDNITYIDDIHFYCQRDDNMYYIFDKNVGRYIVKEENLSMALNLFYIVQKDLEKLRNTETYKKEAELFKEKVDNYKFKKLKRQAETSIKIK